MERLKHQIPLLIFYIIIAAMEVKCDCQTRIRVDYAKPCWHIQYFYPVYFDSLLRRVSGIPFDSYFNYIKCNNINLNYDLVPVELKNEINVSSVDISDSVISSINTFNKVCFLEISNITLNVSIIHLIDADPSLKRLAIKSSNLSEYDINPVSSLKILNLFNNTLTSLTKENYRELNLDILNVSSNRISNIYCENVRLEIDLSDNCLEVINCTFAKSLKHLYLNNNKLKNISKYTFENLTELTVLNLSYNEIDEIENTFSNLIYLKYFNLGNNNINRLKFDCFKNLGNLNHLDLSYNDISVLPNGIFQKLSKLEILDLSYNNIIKLNIGALYVNYGRSSEVLELELKGNDLEDVDINSLKRMDILHKISFSFHYISCQKLKKYIDTLEGHNIKVKTGEFLYMDNVKGILCKMRNSTELYETSFEFSLHSLMKTHITLTIITICFLILMILFVVILYYRSKL